MIYRFDRFELDLAAVELRADGEVVKLERQVFGLLAFLLENRERLVSKDEIIEKVWDGRIVTDAAVASRVKSARQALGDDGKSQQFIKTIHGQGYRFVAQAKALRNPAAAHRCGARGQRRILSGRPRAAPRPAVPPVARRIAVSVRRRR